MRKPVRKFTIEKLTASQQATIKAAEERLKKYVPTIPEKELKDTILYFAEAEWKDRGEVLDEFLTDVVDREIKRRTGKKTMRQVKNEQDGIF